MSEQILDLKLKRLIQLCKETGNYKKLAVVSFLLVSNAVNEIGIKLGFRSREKDSGEKIFEYMKLINKIFSFNFNISVFKPELIEHLSEKELLFLKRQGNIDLEKVKGVIEAYYELRKLEVPNLHENINSELLNNNRTVSMFSFLSGGQSKRRKRESAFHPILMQKFKEEERALQLQIENQFDKNAFEKILHLKTVRKNLEQKSRGKIVISGSLKDNISYRQSEKNISQLMIFSLIILFAMIGAVLLTESFMYGVLSMSISNTTLICFGVIVILIFINKLYYGKR
ncbi:MAG: hypothetical protein KGD68_13620 [Candidatus Lokiarchaeota archaeon]|nr:hypothetical protein [Candidatus Lokiarchaeota archaeon]